MRIGLSIIGGSPTKTPKQVVSEMAAYLNGLDFSVEPVMVAGVPVFDSTQTTIFSWDTEQGQIGRGIAPSPTGTPNSCLGEVDLTTEGYAGFCGMTFLNQFFYYAQRVRVRTLIPRKRCLVTRSTLANPEACAVSGLVNTIIADAPRIADAAGFAFARETLHLFTPFNYACCNVT